MFDGITHKKWECWEAEERCFRDHPSVYRFKLALLLAEGIVASLLMFAPIVLLFALCVIYPRKCVPVLCIFGINILVAVPVYRIIMKHRPWLGLPELQAKDWPHLHELVRKTANAVGAPPIHRIFLDPVGFHSSVSIAFPLVPGLRRNMLILGYPLLAALGKRGLRGIIAREIGYCVHRDTVFIGALFRIRVFWRSIELGLFSQVLAPWRIFYLRRFDRLVSPIERARKLAADRSVAKLVGEDALREVLVTMALRDADSDVEKIMLPLAVSELGAPTSPSEAIRAAMRRAIPADDARRRIERALRSVLPPMSNQLPLAVRADASDAQELLPFASVSQDALESVFGSVCALDGQIDRILEPELDKLAVAVRERHEKCKTILNDLPAAETASPDEILDRVSALVALGRKDEVISVLRAGRTAHPDNVALETAELCFYLSSEAASDEECKPIADRLEELIEKEPMMRFIAEKPLFRHYQRIGSVERIKNLLNILQYGEMALKRHIGVELKSTDSICAEQLSDGELAELQKTLARHRRKVKEVYVVRKIIEDTGLSIPYLVVRMRWFATTQDVWLLAMDVRDSFRVKMGNRAFFRRFAELGIAPITILKKES